MRVTMKNRAYIWFVAVALVCGLTIMVHPTAVAQDQNISTVNTSRFLGKDRWEWTVYIKASSSQLANIRCVEYKLPSTFTDPNRKVCRIGDTNQPFALRGSGWGTFNIPTRVVFKNSQKPVILNHKLTLERSR